MYKWISRMNKCINEYIKDEGVSLSATPGSSTDGAGTNSKVRREYKLINHLLFMHTDIYRVSKKNFAVLREQFSLESYIFHLVLGAHIFFLGFTLFMLQSLLWVYSETFNNEYI